MSIRPFYDQWPQYNQRLTDVVAGMTIEQLSLRPDPSRAPIWATAAHCAAVRVYWLCFVIGEPGAETTPFTDPDAPGWEDDESRPRDGEELAMALGSTWKIVEGCLDRWTPELMSQTVERMYGDQRQIHSRSSILQRLFSHDAYHCGELSQTLGIAGMRQIDLWAPDVG